MFLNFCSAVWGAEAAAAGALVCGVSALAFGPSDCVRGPSAAYSKPALIQIAARTRVGQALVLMLSPGLNCHRFFLELRLPFPSKTGASTWRVYRATPIELALPTALQ